MKETINVNIGGSPFIMDIDAYQALKSYLDDIRSRIDGDDPEEVVGDIENRIAEIFADSIHAANQVVDMALVRRVIAVIGRADTFGERKRTGGTFVNPDRGPASRKLRRSNSDRVIAGICGGVADYFGIDPTLVRILTFLLIFLGGLSLWVYIAMWIIIPNEPTTPPYRGDKR